MDVRAFDQCIQLTFDHYGQLTQDAVLLSVEDQRIIAPPRDWICVEVRVQPVAPHADAYAERWLYAGVVQKSSGPVSIGGRTMDRARLVGCEAASKRLPPGFPTRDASGALIWPIHPVSTEPCYLFTFGSMCHAVGAYSGNYVGEARV